MLSDSTRLLLGTPIVNKCILQPQETSHESLYAHHHVPRDHVVRLGLRSPEGRHRRAVPEHGFAHPGEQTLPEDVKRARVYRFERPV
jgi:hypothetical protein